MGFSLTAIALFLDAATGGFGGVIIALFLIFLGICFDAWGICLIGLLVLIFTLIFTINSIVHSGKAWWDNLINRF